MAARETIYPRYEAPTLTVDAAILQLVNDQLYILLIKRNRDPFAGMYALPGAYVPKGETTRRTIERMLYTKAGVTDKSLGLVRQLYATDTVARDPRGHAVSIVYVGLGRNIPLASNPDVEEPQFFPINDLPKPAFDHAEIIVNVMAYLKDSIMDADILSALLPEKFTLTQLQSAYETLLGHSLDKRNFRKKITALGLVGATAEYHKEGAHRPAQLYRFTQAAFTPSEPAFA